MKSLVRTLLSPPAVVTRATAFVAWLGWLALGVVCAIIPAVGIVLQNFPVEKNYAQDHWIGQQTDPFVLS